MSNVVISNTRRAWETKNPIIPNGEFGLDRDSRKLKLGDGITPWNDLWTIGGGVSSRTKTFDGGAP